MPPADDQTPADSETLAWSGGAVKALDDAGRVGGYLVLFGSPAETDATKDRDYFTAATDFGLDVAAKSRILYHHGLTRKLGARSLGVASLKADEAGVWMEGQLELRDAYERKIFEAVKNGRMGLSSGSAVHLVRKERQPNGAHKITSWPLGLDASITPTPAEPRTLAVAVKSLADADADGLFDAAKGLLMGDTDEAATMAALDRLHSTFSMCLYSVVCGAAPETPRAETLARVEAAFAEYRDAAVRVVTALLKADDSDSAEDLKSLLYRSRDRLCEGLSLSDHSDSVCEAVKGLSLRYDRVLDGHDAKARPLSNTKVDALKSLSDAVAGLRDRAARAGRGSAPSPAEILRLQADLLAFEARSAGLID